MEAWGCRGGQAGVSRSGREVTKVRGGGCPGERSGPQGRGGSQPQLLSVLGWSPRKPPSLSWAGRVLFPVTKRSLTQTARTFHQQYQRPLQGHLCPLAPVPISCAILEVPGCRSIRAADVGMLSYSFRFLSTSPTHPRENPGAGRMQTRRLAAGCQGRAIRDPADK